MGPPPGLSCIQDRKRSKKYSKWCPKWRPFRHFELPLGHLGPLLEGPGVKISCPRPILCTLLKHRFLLVFLLVFPGKGVGPGFFFSRSGIWPSPPTPCYRRVGGLFCCVFTCSLLRGPFRKATLHAISRDSYSFVPLGKALFTLFAVVAPLWARSAGKGGLFYTRPHARIRLPPWRASVARILHTASKSSILRGLVARREDGHFTRYFT